MVRLVASIIHLCPEIVPEFKEWNVSNYIFDPSTIYICQIRKFVIHIIFKFRLFNVISINIHDTLYLESCI